MQAANVALLGARVLATQSRRARARVLAASRARPRAWPSTMRVTVHDARLQAWLSRVAQLATLLFDGALRRIRARRPQHGRRIRYAARGDADRAVRRQRRLQLADAAVLSVEKRPLSSGRAARARSVGRRCRKRKFCHSQTALLRLETSLGTLHAAVPARSISMPRRAGDQVRAIKEHARSYQCAHMSKMFDDKKH